VWRTVLELGVGNGQCSIAFWVYNAGALAPGPGDLSTFAGNVFDFVVGPLLNFLPYDAGVSAFQVDANGSAPLRLTGNYPPNHGAIGTEAAPLNAAGCISWLTQYGGRGGSRTLLPLPIGYRAADPRRVSAFAQGQLVITGDAIIAGFNSIPSLAGPPCTLVSLHRQQGGVPLAAAVPRLIVGCNADQLIASCRRRIPSGR
jgi:hypothetical protein